MDEQLIGILEKGKTRDLRAQLTTYHGHKYLELRTFVVTDASDERAPTKKGITCPVNLIPELRQFLEQAEAAARATGLLSDDAEAA